MEDHNGKAYVEKLRNEVLQNLACLDAAPGVQMHEAPPDGMVPRWVAPAGVCACVRARPPWPAWACAAGRRLPAGGAGARHFRCSVGVS
jgi:hypothetical protein